jgi:filamentous hemagglutinin
MDDLRDRPDVDWQAVTAAQETWDYSDQGLTEAGAALVALAVAAVSGGTGLGVPCSRCPYGYRSRWPSVAYSK